MKKFFTMVLMSLAFVACNKEENKETPKEEVVSIEGTWHLENDFKIENGETKILPTNDCRKNNTFNFLSGVLKIISHEKHPNECKALPEETGSYTISGNNITLKIEQEITKWTFSLSMVIF